jgi:tetratricopeptide (TPR) repeat protein
MFQRDYILRMIEQMTEMIASISGLKKQHKQELAFDQIDDLLGRYFRMNSQLLNTLSEKDLLAMLTVGTYLDPERVLVLARVLREEAGLYDSMGKPDESYSRLVKALQLTMAASEEEPRLRMAMISLTEELRESLKGYRLPQALLLRLTQHYERAGQFDKAEDQLFEALDDAPDGEMREGVVAAGRGLYQRLLELGDDTLEAGGLPRGEISEGLKELQQRAEKQE